MNTSPETDPLALPLGTQLGSYRVVSPLGKGGMGTVYVVERDGRRFAAKFTRRKLSDLSASEREHTDARVRREISALWAVSHPNLIRIHGSDRWPDMSGYLYLVMDLIDGEPLAGWQAKTKPSLRKLTECFLGIASGVQALHRAYFIHRDLKSDNVVVDGEGRPVIIDFGISRQRDSYTLTSNTSIVGTSDHLSPEFCRFIIEVRGMKGERYEYRPTDDLHAVGFMLYEALCGQPPFEMTGESEWDLLRDIATRVPPPPKSLCAAVPESLSAIAMRLLEKEPEKRFQSGRELEDALKSALDAADASWDAPFEPPPYQPRTERGTAGVAGSASGAGAVVSIEAAGAQLELPSQAGKPRPPIASAIADTVQRPQVVYQVPEVAVPKAAEPAPVLSLESRPGFVSLDAPAKKVEAPRPEAGLPSGVLDALDVVKRPSTASGSRILLAGLGVLAAVILLFALGALRSKSPEHPKDLLKSFEQQRTQELAASNGVPQSLEASPTAIPPAERVRMAPANDPIPAPSAPAQQPISRAAPAGEAPPSQSSRSRRRHHGKVTAQPQLAKAEALAQPPAPQPNAPRSLLRSSAMREVAEGSAPVSTSLGVQRGQMFQARLSLPVSPQALGPVTAVVTADVVVNGRIAVPRNSTLVGSAVSAEGSRVRIRWDTLNVQGGGAVPIEALAYGADQLPGIPYRAPEVDSSPSPTKDAALSTGEHILNRFLGDDVAGDLGRGAAGAAAETARAPSHSDARPVVISKGPAIYVFVTQAF